MASNLNLSSSRAEPSQSERNELEFRLMPSDASDQDIGRKLDETNNKNYVSKRDEKNGRAEANDRTGESNVISIMMITIIVPTTDADDATHQSNRSLGAMFGRRRWRRRRNLVASSPVQASR